MGISEQDIQELFNYYEEKRYQDTKDLLSSFIDKDPNNFHIYYLKAVCCIQMLQFDEALINLGEGAYLYPDYVPSMYALAYLFLKRGDFESAMDKWLAIKTVAPKDPLVNNILQRVKSGQLKKDPLNRYASDDFIQPDLKELRKGLLFSFPQKIKELVPIAPSLSSKQALPGSPGTALIALPPPKKKQKFKSKMILLGLVLIFALYFGSRIFYQKSAHSPEDLSMTQENLVLFSFQTPEIQAKQTALRTLIREKNYNKTVVQMNELTYSNAPESVKKWVLGLRKSLPKPQDTTELGEQFSMPLILKNPYLYQGVFLDLKGSVSNFLRRPQYITFDLNIAHHLKISNIYFFDTSTEELPFDNQDELSVFGFFRLDEHGLPLLEDTSVSLIKTSPRAL